MESKEASGDARRSALYEVCKTRFDRRLERLKQEDKQSYRLLISTLKEYADDIDIFPHDPRKARSIFYKAYSDIEQLADRRGEQPIATVEWLFNRYEKSGKDAFRFVMELTLSGSHRRRFLKSGGSAR